MDTKAHDWLELLMSFYKHLLCIPDVEDAMRPSGELTHLHDRLIMKFHQDHVLEILIAVCAFLGTQKTNGVISLIVLECFYHIFRLEDPLSLYSPSQVLKTKV
jgi:hypothetical protein